MDKPSLVANKPIDDSNKLASASKFLHVLATGEDCVASLAYSSKQLTKTFLYGFNLISASNNSY